jgi:hypothetical protein
MRPITTVDLCIKQSGMYRLVVTVVGGPASLIGFGGAMQIRKTRASTVVLAEMLPQYFNVDDGNRQLVLEIPDEDTALYDWEGWAVYDLFLTNGTDRWPLCEGRVQLDKAVTRS